MWMILREGMFSVLPIALELRNPGIFVLKKGKRKKRKPCKYSLFTSIIARDVYRYQKSIRYVSSIHCFDTRYVSSMLICSKYQDKQVPVLMTGPPEPHFNKCTTSLDSGVEPNSTQSNFGVE